MLCLLSLCANAQHFPFVHYGTEEGLPDANVYDLIETKEGDLLIATERGAVIFDGLSFVNFDARKEHVYTGSIIRVFQDDTGAVWLGSHKNGIFTGQRNRISSTGIFTPTAQALAVRNQKIYIHGDKIQTIDLQNNTIKTLSESNSTDQLIAGKDQSLYLLHGRMVSAIDSSGIARKILSHPDGMSFISCEPQQNGNLLLSAAGGIMMWDGNELATLATLPEETQPNNLHQDRMGRIWFSDQHSGIYVLEHGSIHNLGKNLDLDRLTVTKIMEGSRGNIWVTTKGSGIYRFHHTYLRCFDQKEGYDGGIIHRIVNTADGRAIIAANEDLYLLDKSELNAAGFTCCILNQDLTILDSSHIAMATHDRSKSYPGEENLEAFGFTFKPYLAYATAISDSTLYLSYYANLIESRKSEERNILIQEGEDFTHRTNCLLADSNRLWQGTSKGLRLVDTNGNVLKDWTLGNDPNRSDQMELEVKELMVVENEVWVLQDQQVLRVHRTNFQVLEPMLLDRPVTGMNAMTIDLDGRLWIGSTSGLYCFENDSLQLLLHQNNGLVSSYVTSLAYEPTANQMLIGTNKGLNTLNMAQWQAHKEEKPEVNVGLIAADSDTLHLSKSEVPRISDRALLKVHFNARHLSEAGQLFYRYTLDGVDLGLSREDHINLSSLETGEHVLQAQVKTTNSDWSAPATVSFQVARPWYRSSLFFASLAFSALAIGLIVRLRIQHQSHQQRVSMIEARLEINRLQQRSLQALMRPHFSSNVIAAVRQSLKTDDRLSADTAMSQLSQLMRTNLEMAQAETVSIQNEVEWLKTYIELERFARGAHWNFELEVDSALSIHQVHIPPMLIQPFVENAIVHGMSSAEPWLQIQFTRVKETCVVVVTDNGPGINPDNKQEQHGHTSYSISLVQERLAMLTQLNNKPFTCELRSGRPDGEAFGTEVTLTLPLN